MPGGTTGRGRRDLDPFLNDREEPGCGRGHGPNVGAARGFARNLAGREEKVAGVTYLLDRFSEWERRMFERILVAFDGSPESRQAARVAVDLATKLHSSVTLVSVHPDSTAVADGQLQSLVPLDDEGKSLSLMVEELRRSALAAGVPGLEWVVLYGEVVPAILGYLASHPHDLAVAGTRELSRGRRLLVGSVSNGLAVGAPCPVLIVPTRKGRRPAR